MKEYQVWLTTECMKNPEYKNLQDQIDARIVQGNKHNSTEMLKLRQSVLREIIANQQGSRKLPYTTIQATEDFYISKDQKSGHVYFKKQNLQSVLEEERKKKIILLGTIAGISSLAGLCYLGFKYFKNKQNNKS